MKTRAIISFHFTRVHVHEATQLERLLTPLYDFGNVFADSGYLSVNNCRVIVSKGGTPFIRPKKTTTGRGTYSRMVMYGNPFTDIVDEYKHDPHKCMKNYHQLSNI